MNKFITLTVYVDHAKLYVRTRIAVSDIGYYRAAVPPHTDTGFTNVIPKSAETVMVLKSEKVGLFVLETPFMIDDMLTALSIEDE